MSDMRKAISDALYRIGKDADGTVLDLTLTAQRTPVVNALLSAIGDVPEPVPGPFVTTESVALRELHYLVDELEGEQDAGVIWNKVNDRIGKLLQRTLAAPAIELEWQAACTKALLEAQERYVKRIAELEAQLQKHENSIGWTGDQVVGIAELLEQLDISDQFLSNPAVWRALLANYVEARSKTPEHAADIRANCGLAGVSGEPAQAGGEWSAEDYDTAAVAVLEARRAGDSTHSLAVAALDAVRHRLAASVIEPLSAELRAEAECLASNDHCIGWAVANELLGRCPKPAPRQRTAEEIGAALVNSPDENTFARDLAELVALAKRGEASK